MLFQNLLEKVQTWLKENSDFVNDITNPINAIERNDNKQLSSKYGLRSEFEKRRKKYNEDYKNKSAGNFLVQIVVDDKTWNLRFSGMQEYARELCNDDIVIDTDYTSYINWKSEYYFFQNVSRYVNNIIAESVIENYKLSNIQPLESYLISLPNKPDYFSDVCKVVVEKNIQNSTKLGNIEVLDNLDINTVDAFCTFIRRAGVWDLKGYKFNNIRKKDDCYIWVDTEKDPFRHISSILEEEKINPQGNGIRGLEELHELSLKHNKKALATITIRHAKEWYSDDFHTFKQNNPNKDYRIDGYFSKFFSIKKTQRHESSDDEGKGNRPHKKSKN